MNPGLAYNGLNDPDLIRRERPRGAPSLTRDLEIARKGSWYRVGSLELAGRIRGGLKQFQSDSFKTERRSVRYFAPIRTLCSEPGCPDDDPRPSADQ